MKENGNGFVDRLREAFGKLLREMREKRNLTSWRWLRNYGLSPGYAEDLEQAAERSAPGEDFLGKFFQALAAQSFKLDDGEAKKFSMLWKSWHAKTNPVDIPIQRIMRCIKGNGNDIPEVSDVIEIAKEFSASMGLESGDEDLFPWDDAMLEKLVEDLLKKNGRKAHESRGDPFPITVPQISDILVKKAASVPMVIGEKADMLPEQLIYSDGSLKEEPLNSADPDKHQIISFPVKAGTKEEVTMGKGIEEKELVRERLSSKIRSIVENGGSDHSFLASRRWELILTGVVIPQDGEIWQVCAKTGIGDVQKEELLSLVREAL